MGQHDIPRPGTGNVTYHCVGGLGLAGLGEFKRWRGLRWQLSSKIFGQNLGLSIRWVEPIVDGERRKYLGTCGRRPIHGAFHSATPRNNHQPRACSRAFPPRHQQHLAYLGSRPILSSYACPPSDVITSLVTPPSRSRAQLLRDHRDHRHDGHGPHDAKRPGGRADGQDLRRTPRLPTPSGPRLTARATGKQRQGRLRAHGHRPLLR